MGSAVPGWPESPRAEPAHWLLAVLKCFDPSRKACGQTPATFTYCSLQASKTTMLQHTHFYCGGAGGCGSCCLFGHKMKKMVKVFPLFFSSLAASAQCWDWDG